MFSKQNHQDTKDDAPSPHNAETIIGPSVKVKGNFYGEGNMVVDGLVEGNIKTSNKLFVGTKAKITANVEAKEARIGGEIRGNIKIDGYLEVTANAKITGDIEANSLSVEKGAHLNGKCTVGKEEKPHHHLINHEKKAE